MSSFITITDYDAAVHTEILNAVTRQDDAILDIMEDQAMEEMTGYLDARYDASAIFSQTGDNRHPLIKMFCMDITLYHLHSIHNPVKFPQIRKDRYERAVAWLKEVQQGNISPNGLPLKTDSDGNQGGATSFIMSSNAKRDNHF
jgi:phage gp36-like protein